MLPYSFRLNNEPSCSIAREEIFRLAPWRAGKINEKYHILTKILKRHEADIQNRWMEKNRAQRRDVLLKAWPGMPAKHRPDLQALKQDETIKASGNEARFEIHYKFPHLNQEDLLRGGNFLSILKARGRNHPSIFAHSDYESMPHKEAYEPGQGLLILEVQLWILTFLLRCRYQILHNIPPDVMVSEQYPIIHEPSLKVDVETCGFESRATTEVDAPYRMPAKLDFGRVVALLTAQISYVEDHIWSLREDTSYFIRCFTEYVNHQADLGRDSTGRSLHPSDPSARHSLRASVTREMLLEAHLNLESVSELRRQARDLQSLQRKCAASQQHSSKLAEGLCVFSIHLIQAARLSLDCLQKLFEGSPPMQKYYVHQSPAPGLSDAMLPRNAQMTKAQEDLHWLLKAFWEKGRFNYPPPKDQNREHIDAVRQAERCLDAFWASVDQYLKSEWPLMFLTATYKLLSQPRIFVRTINEIDDFMARSKGGKKRPRLSTLTAGTYRPLSSLYCASSGQNSEETEPSKRRKITQEPIPQAISNDGSEVMDTPMAIAVDARSLKVFRALYFNSLATSSLGSLLWADFVYAMTSIGSIWRRP
ncbi:hypothetical protein TARUN_968 [Trichoderma arundinaceum]|uniref:Uncharacterized protein n=1 Tax=Trichoderma arundinaceum TaxID=490622 RepID=A0A395P0E8_TRIAR|nr:hypothetical protein TARUN_968 [Trichoderma arundinaceum]